MKTLARKKEWLQTGGFRRHIAFFYTVVHNVKLEWIIKDAVE